MDDREHETPKLPGNHGQFGEGDSTETYDRLEDQPAPEPKPKAGPPKQTNAGERS